MTNHLLEAWEALTGPRIEDHWVELLDADGNPIGPLDGVESGRVEQNVNSTIRGGLSLTLRESADGPLDWNTVRFRPWVRANGFTWPLGEYIPASPTFRKTKNGKFWDVPCVDKTSVLNGDILTETYTVLAGANVTDAVSALIIGAGESSKALTPSDLALRSTLTWEPTTPKLRVVNDLLEAINYFSIWADRRGQLRAEPYRRPQDRPIAAYFAEGEASIHSPEWSRNIDIASIPNRVVLTVNGDDTVPGLISVASNTDPNSPFSIPRRAGRVQARPYPNVEAADQATLDAMAQRYLTDAGSPSAVLEVQHAQVPLSPNDVVRFSDGGVDTLAVVESFSVTLAVGAMMSGSWREVVSV